MLVSRRQRGKDQPQGPAPISSERSAEHPSCAHEQGAMRGVKWSAQVAQGFEGAWPIRHTETSLDQSWTAANRVPTMPPRDGGLAPIDVFVLVVAAVGTLRTFSSDGAVSIRPAFVAHFDDHLHSTARAAAEQENDADADAKDIDIYLSTLLPPPVVADLDGDGTPEVLVPTLDGRLLLLSAVVDPAQDPEGFAADEREWRELPVRKSASLRSHAGLAKGRRPMAVSAGYLNDVADADGRRRQVVVAVTEDWSVLAFDHELRLLWEHSIGRAGVGAEAAPMREVVVTISSHPIYKGDVGLVLIGGQTRPRSHSREAAPKAAQHPHGHAAPAAPTPSLAEWAHHFDYVALEGGSGSTRWEHTALDFHRALHGDESLTPQMDYRLDLQSIGGGAGGLDGRHDGERPWRLFGDSVHALLPHSWRHPHDARIHLATFERTRRAHHATRRERAAASAAAKATGAHTFTATRLLAAAAAGATAAKAPSKAPNVAVARRRHGIEVLHLYTGRTLTQLPLYSSTGPSAHADVNGDGAIDHVGALSSQEAEAWHTAWRSGAETASRGSGDVPTCLGLASSGLPVREALWNVTVGHGGRRQAMRRGAATPAQANRRRFGLELGVAAPLLLPQAIPHAMPQAMPDALGGASSRSARFDALFLTSDGKVTSVHPLTGRPNWVVSTDASWRLELAEAPADRAAAVEAGGGGAAWAGAALLPSLTLVRPRADAGGLDSSGLFSSSLGDALILAIGESAAVLLSADGKVLTTTRLPQTTNGPPVLADFTGDGLVDIILPGERAHLGLCVEAGVAASGAGVLVQKILFGFAALAVVLVVIVKYGEVDLLGAAGLKQA